MSDIFISYKREDRQYAERLSIALEQLGFDVWWDFELLSGDKYRSVIRAVIDQCKAVVVLWSDLAVESNFVMDEATYAQRLSKLCPCRIDDVELPFGFGQEHTDDLSHWQGQLSHPGFQALVRAVEARVGRQGQLGVSARAAPDARARAAELDAFKAAQLANNESALRAFLKAFPKGGFASFVRGQLQTMGVTVAAGGDGLGDFPPQMPPQAPPRPDPPPQPNYGFQSTPSAAPPAQTGGGPNWRLIASVLGVIAVIALALALWPRPPAPSAAPTDIASAAPGDYTPPADSSADVKALQDQLEKERAAREREAANQQNTNTAPATTTPAYAPPFDLAQLNSAVRSAASQARAAEAKALAIAAKARAGESGYVVNSSPGKDRYEGTTGAAGTQAWGADIWPDGARYAGSFISGTPVTLSGYGVYRFANGYRYEGQFANNKYNGYGVYWAPDGSISSAGFWTDNNLTTPMTK